MVYVSTTCSSIGVLVLIDYGSILPMHGHRALAICKIAVESPRFL